MFKLFRNFLSLEKFYFFSKDIQLYILAICLISTFLGLWLGLFVAPADYQQGEAFRIIYVHVPSAWMSLFVYMYMTVAAIVSLIWRLKIAEIGLRSAGPIGMCFTAIALVTGSIWGKPMWGTWWVWDARLTSELILLFIYIGIIGLIDAPRDPRTGAKIGAVMTIIGAVNIPIIHFSVEWWNTLHQGPTITKFDAPSIAISMLIPLLAMTVAFMTYFSYTLLTKMNTEILSYERNSSWVRKLIASGGG